MRESSVCVVMLFLTSVLSAAMLLCFVWSLNHFEPPVLLVHLYSANHATLAYLLTALHVSFMQLSFGDDVGFASLRSADGVSLVCVHAEDDVPSVYLQVADAAARCSGW